jgi:hypothetical protein
MHRSGRKEGESRCIESHIKKAASVRASTEWLDSWMEKKEQDVVSHWEQLDANANWD